MPRRRLTMARGALRRETPPRGATVAGTVTAVSRPHFHAGTHSNRPGPGSVQCVEGDGAVACPAPCPPDHRERGRSTMKRDDRLALSLRALIPLGALALVAIGWGAAQLRTASAGSWSSRDDTLPM